MAKSKQCFLLLQQAVSRMGEGRQLVDVEILHGDAAFLAIEHTLPGQPAVRTAAIASFAFGQDEQGNETVSVKDFIGEEHNPAVVGASGRLLGRLSAPATAGAAEWRKRCLAHLADRRRRFGPQPGDIITTHGQVCGQEPQAFYILHTRGRTTAYGLGLLDGRKYRLRFDERNLTAVLHGKQGPEATLHARYNYAYQAGMPAGEAAGCQDDLAPWETRLHVIKRRYLAREPLAFALRRPCLRFGLNWPLAVLAVGTPQAIAAQVTAHNQIVPDEQPSAIRRQDCWI